MSVVASSLVAQVSVSGASQAESALKGVGKASEGASGMLGSLGGFALGAGAALAGTLVGIGATAAKMAGDFQTSMTQLVTGAGESQSNLKMVSDGILAMAGETGNSTKDLASGMYLIESAGQHGTQALITLRDAAEGAKVGAASLADVANGVTTIMTDYAAKHISAAQATNTLIAAVSAGKVHLGDLSTAMSTVLPTAAAIGVNLGDVAAAMATMTGEGTNAAAAATYLRQMLIALDNPSAKGAKALKLVGLTSTEVATEMKKSLPDTLQMITDAVGKKFPVGSSAYVKALADISGGSKQMQGMLELTGAHLKVFQGNLEAISKAVSQGGDAIMGWNLVQGDFNQQLDKAKGAAEGFMISIGTALLPILTKVVSVIVPIITGITTWITKNDILGKAITAIGNGVKWFIGLLAPLQPLFGAIGDIAQTTFSDLIRTFQQVGDAISEVFGGMSQADGGKVKSAFSSITTGVLPILQNFGITIHGIFVGIQNTLDSLNVSGVISTIHQMLVPALAGFAAMALAVVIPAVISLATTVWSLAAAVIAATWPILAIGVAVAGVTALLLYAYQNWAGFRDVVNAVGSAISALWNALPNLWDAFSHGVVVQTIMAVLQQLGSFISGQFTGIWQTLVDLWTTQLLPAFSQIWSSLQPLMPLFQLIAEIIGGVLVAAIGLLIGGLEGLIKGFANLVTGIALILTGLIQVVTGVFDIIAGIVRIFIDLVTGNFNDLGPALGAIWQGIVDVISGALNTIRGIFVATFGTIIGFVSGFAQGVAGFFGSIYDAVTGKTKDMSDKATANTKTMASNMTATTQDMSNKVTTSAQDMSTHVNYATQKMSDGVQTTTKTMAHYTQGTIDTLRTNADNITQDMAYKVEDHFKWMSNQSLTDVTGFSDNAKNVLQGLGDDGTRIMKSLDASTQLYWNDIANYISLKSAQAAAAANEHLGSIHVGGKTYGPVNPIAGKNIGDPTLPHHAFGTNFAPGGPSIVGENGPELVYMPRGAQVIPNSQLSGGLFGSGSNGSNQPIHVHVHIADQEFSYLTNAIMDNAARQTRRQYGSRRF